MVGLSNSPYTTNRILEIPQDIKLELNNGTLTLKAGSKVYVPNGFETDGTTPKFDVVITTQDVTGLEWFSTSTLKNQMVFVRLDGSGIDSTVYTSSGASYPSSPRNGDRCYRTDLNLLYTFRTSNNQWNLENCLPIAIVQPSSTEAGKTASIDQVFNGFGYIGSTVFALPGVKYEYANGLNSDGTYINGFAETTSVLTTTYTYPTSTAQSLFIANDGHDYLWRCGHFFVVENPPTSGLAYCVWYVQSLNCFYSTGDGTTVPKSHKGMPFIQIASNIETNSLFRITNIDFETVDGLLTSNANNLSSIGRSYLSGIGMPSTHYENWTLGASGSTYTAPANGYIQLVKYAGGVNQHINIAFLDLYTGIGTSDGVGITYSNYSGQPLMLFVPVAKGQRFYGYYDATGATTTFKFIYAEGEK